MRLPDCTYYLVDIDGTLTNYRPGAFDSQNLLHGNFLFPIIRDLMLEQGWKKTAAEQAIADFTERVIFWDYSDFIAEFHLPAPEAFHRMRQWHAENILPCDDGVALVKQLHAAGKQLFIMSNNPYTGCMFKLEAAGLAGDVFSSPYFRRVFGTNILRGCKGAQEVWLRALAQIPADPSDVCAVGDNPKEDGAIPRECGIIHSILLERREIAKGVEHAGKGN